MSADDRNRTCAVVGNQSWNIAIACSLAMVLLTTAAPAKDERSVTAVGPPVRLSAAQQAALAAKRAALPPSPAPVAVTSPAKATPVVTIDAHPAVRLPQRQGPPPARLVPSRRAAESGPARPSSATRPRPWSPAATQVGAAAVRPDARYLDELRTALGRERSIAAGLVKSGSREWSGGASKPVREERP